MLNVFIGPNSTVVLILIYPIEGRDCVILIALVMCAIYSFALSSPLCTNTLNTAVMSTTTQRNKSVVLQTY